MATPEAAPFPVRFMRRRLTHTAISGAVVLKAPVKGDLTQTLVLYALMCSNVAHLPYASPEALRVARGLDSLDEGLRRPVSVNALAASLRMPFETARRKLQALEAQGLCLRVPGGLITPASVAAGPEIGAALAELHRHLIAAATRLEAGGVDLDAFALQMAGAAPEAPAAGPAHPMIEARVVLDAMLRVMESWRAAFGGLSSGYALLAIVDANTDGLDDGDPCPPRYAYAHTPPPDALRRPVTPAMLAERLTVPVSTVRRWLAEFAAAGTVVEAAPGRFIVPAAVVDSGALAEIAQPVAIYGARMFADLHRLGRRFSALRPALARV